MIQAIFMICYFTMLREPLGCHQAVPYHKFPTIATCNAWAKRNKNSVARYHAPVEAYRHRRYRYEGKHICRATKVRQT